MDEPVKRAIETASKLVENMPDWQRGVLQRSGEPMLAEPREEVAVPPPGYRWSERFRWAWDSGKWRIYARDTEPENFDDDDAPEVEVWWPTGGDYALTEAALKRSYPDFAWGPWALEPINNQNPVD